MNDMLGSDAFWHGCYRVALIAALERAGMLPLWAKQSVVVLQPVTGNRVVDTAMLCDLGRLG